MLSDHKFGQVVHRSFIEANGIKLEMIQLERPISKTLSDGLSVKDLQPRRDAEMFEILLTQHQVMLEKVKKKEKLALKRIEIDLEK